MSWIDKLCAAYDSGIDTDQSGESFPLIPVGFTQKEIKYHIVLSETGEFVSAEEWDAKTFQIVPSTAGAESRTGDKGAPFPLADQLKYLVSEEGGNPRLQKYMEQLSAWCELPEAPPCLGSLRHYLEQGTLLTDLTEKAQLKVRYYKDADSKREYGADAKAFAIFSVQSGLDDEQGDELWKRRDVRESWAAYLASAEAEASPLCYAEGKPLPGIDSHPKVQGNAKLISAKDNEYPFQYKGRFVNDRSSANVSYDASIRAHNALGWLIRRQGFQKYGMTTVVWNTNGCPMSPPIAGSPLLLSSDGDKPKPDTFEAYARYLKTAAEGYSRRLETFSKSGRVNEVVILSMEAATDGRMSITYYQELPGNEYVHRLEQWYASCCWPLWSREQSAFLIATPTPRQIAEAVMGPADVKTAEQDKNCEKAASKLMRQLHMRLLSCIADAAPLPENLVRSAFHRSVSPLSFTDRDGKWSEFDWRNCLAVTCALIHRKQSESGIAGETVLDTDCTDRDYLYGRLFAAADFAEWDMEERPRGYLSNAIRLMQRYVQRPFETWPLLHTKLIPYLGKSGDKREKYQSLLGQIELRFSAEDRRSAAPLSDVFLQGYYCQRQALFQEAAAAKPVPYALPEDRSELYGCLLAIADLAEIAGTDTDSRRGGMTNALRTMAACAADPLTVWPRIHARVLPYLERLGAGSRDTFDLFRQVESRFSPADRDSAAPLDGAYLRGYYSMRQALLDKRFTETPPCPDPSPAPITRDRVYGRLLHLENRVERLAMDVIQRIPKEEYRPSNALRWMERFAAKPDEVWHWLRIKLTPYADKLRRRGGKRYLEEIEALEALLEENHWNNDAPLGGSYLNSYYKNQ